MLQKPLSGSHRTAFLFAPRHTDILDRSLLAHRRGTFGGMDAAKEPTRTYLRRVPRWWVGKGPATSPQFAPCNQRRRRDETHTEKQNTACAKTASVTSTCMHSDTNPPQSKAPINRQPSAGLSSYAREAAFRTEVLPTRPSTLPSDETRQPPATESLQYRKQAHRSGTFNTDGVAAGDVKVSVPPPSLASV
ncbi:hypothetical protein TR80_008025 [Xanthomonas campestris]|nr:hypothetical protein TR80_008025 [Xanthomonas campestris]